MKVLLVEPPRVNPEGNLRIYGSMGTYKADYIWPPLDLMVIAGYLHENGIDSTILDCNARNLSFNDLDMEMECFQPNLVVFTTSTPTIDSDMKVAQLAFKHGAKSIAIGSHVCLAEPERYVLLAAQGMTPKKEKIKDLDELGISAHEKLDLSLYSDPFQKRKHFGLTYFTRGCRYAECTYCSCPTFFKPMRSRSITLMMSELRWMQHKGIRDFKFFDAEFNNDAEKSLDLCQAMINSDLDMSWQCLARVDNLTLPQLEKWHEAGCHTVHIGVESASGKILHNVRKGITQHWVEEAVKNIRKAGMSPVTYFMLGLPGETKETMRQSLDFVKELNPDATTFSIATPHPNTEFYRYIERNGYFRTHDFREFNPSLKPVFNYPDLSADEIYEFMKLAYKEFYMRKSFLWRTAWKTRTLGQIKQGLKTYKYLKDSYAK